MDTVTVTTKGQIVIPAKTRKKYGLKKGTKLRIIDNGEELILKPITLAYLDSIAGVLKGKKSLSSELLMERTQERRKEK